MRVSLSYYKPTGKWYMDHQGDISIDTRKPIMDVWTRVQILLDSGRAPGISSGQWEGFVIVNAPDHPHNHPRMLLTGVDVTVRLEPAEPRASYVPMHLR